MLNNKTGLILGVANQKSIATGIANVCSEKGARLGFSHLPDETGKMRRRVEMAISEFNPIFIEPLDVNKDSQLDDFFAKVKNYGNLDFMVHSIAFAPLDDIRCPTINASRKGFLEALETSVYSFIATARRAADLMPAGGSLITLTYFGGEKVVGGYNLMGIAKAALEHAVRYLAWDLGPKKIRVNAISAGPVKTLAASAIGDFGDMLGMAQAISPLQENVTAEGVGELAAFLASDGAKHITGDLLHVDSGYHIMGSPGHALNLWNIKPREFLK